MRFLSRWHRHRLSIRQSIVGQTIPDQAIRDGFFWLSQGGWMAAPLASPPPPPHQHQQPQPQPQPAHHPADWVGRAEQPARCRGALLHQPLLQQKPAAHQASVESDRASHQPAIGPALQPQNHAQQDQPAEASRGPWRAAERRSSANQPRGPPAARRQSRPASEPAPPPCRLTRGQHATSSAGGLLAPSYGWGLFAGDRRIATTIHWVWNRVRCSAAD